MRREDDDARQGQWTTRERAKKVITVHARHLEIEHDDERREASSELFERCDPILCQNDLAALAPEDEGDELAHIALVVDDEDGKRAR